GILEQMDIPYTGSEVLASRLAMDKIASRQIFESAGLLVPRYRVINKSSYRNGWMDRFDFDFPLVVKPAAHGSSIGLSLPAGRSALQGSLKNAFCFDERVLVEEYVKGREMTVGILAHNALPVIEIIPKKIFFDYQAKYQPGFTEYIVPARIPSRIAHALQQAAFHAHTLLGCQGCSRVDMILDQDNRPVILEVNTIPGMTSTSLLPKAARAQGVDFPSLCVRLLELAYEKKKSFSAF
ncbi:MAG: D-alanine--D-alanine ligase, partial [Candidatus Omnitrophica bacterium]|nr:D-alanine--D-alanine ligase [Candidatus Omnitrophota bacterium]